MKLKNLSISSFRGATKPLKVDFDPSKKITMIFGENGNGKTTISDALVCLCTEGCGSIDDKASVDPSYLCAIGSSPTDVAIVLETDTAKFRATLNVKPKATFSKYPNEGLPRVRFLRRKQIMDLLDLQPSQRYERLQEYIDVSGVIASEDELRKLVRNTKADLTSETKSLTDSINTLERIWEQENRPLGSWEEWARTESEKDLTKETGLHKKLTDAIGQWNSILEKLNTIKILKHELEAAGERELELHNQLRELEEKGKAGNAKLLALLESARTFISSHYSLEKCPVCKSTVTKDALDASLADEIESMKALQIVTCELEGVKQSQHKTRTILENTLNEFNAQGTTFSIQVLQFVDQDSAAEKLIQEAKECASNNALDMYCDAHLTAFKDFMGKIMLKAGLTLNTIKQFNAIRENYRTIVRVKDNAQSLQDLLNAGEEALKQVEYLRKTFIDESLSAVSADIEALYSQLHPGETLGGIRLFLHPTRKNSLEILGSFYGENDVTPQSVFSESHLDTLGICIFLALAKKYKDGDTILLLDDVMMSVDDKHLDRVIELLHDETETFEHIIITTHYRPWRDRYRTHRGAGGKVHFIELRNWTKEAGITVQNGRVQMHELELALNDKSYFDRQVIASKSGILLENLLDYLTDIYEFHLPKRKTLKYTLGELMDTLQAKYLKNIKAVHLTVTQNSGTGENVETEYLLQPVVEELKKLMFIRNQVGAHFNLDENASDDDVMLFGRKTLEMAQILVCRRTGQLPLTRCVDHWKSKQGTIKLFPLEKN